MEEIRTNNKIELAREFILKTKTNIFLTGKAGSGKTTFLKSVVERIGKRAVVAAPTGVAALNAGGVTLHSLFQIPFGPNVPGVKMSGASQQRISRNKRALIRSIELLIIDEISMVRCDLLDAIDQTLRSVRRSSKPFAGVQLLLIGDVQQLAPICKEDEWSLLKNHYNSPYFFDSIALTKQSYITIEFDEIFRQKDIFFTDLLNAVRENRATPQILEELNKRYIPNFEPPKEEDYITLTTHNRRADDINSRNLALINTLPQRYKASVKGDFAESAYPNDTLLELKVGAQVLFIKNDPSSDKKFYNGMIGDVVKMGDASVTVKPKSSDDEITVEAITWENLEYEINAETGEMEQRVKGSFTQIPLKCAWAITIHKSQGLSFDRAVIDAAESFAHGQVYVALSRCRTLEGLVLKRPISVASIIGESNVESFVDYVATHQPSSQDLEMHKREYYVDVVSDIFNFSQLSKLSWELMDIFKGAIAKSYPKLVSSLVDSLASFDKDIVGVGRDFQTQLRRAVMRSENYSNDDYVIERLKSATAYFQPRLEPLKEVVLSLKNIDIDSKDARVKIVELRRAMEDIFALICIGFDCCNKGFSAEEYQEKRAKNIARGAMLEQQGVAKVAKSGKTEAKKSGFIDIENEKLYRALLSWREEEAANSGKRPNAVVSVATLIDIQKRLPTTLAELKKVDGMGKTKLKSYSEAILTIVRGYCEKKGLATLHLDIK